MIEQFIYGNWEEPPSEMNFSTNYGELILDLSKTLDRVLGNKDSSFYDDMLHIYLRTRAIPRQALNHKIDTYNSKPNDLEKIEAQQLYLDSIDVARTLYTLRPNSIELLENYYSQLPDLLKDSLYTNEEDKYTWMASNPADIRELATDIVDKLDKVDLILGAAHGSIGPGLVLANILNSEVYFVRFSKYKRDDTKPIISDQDLEYLTPYKEKKVILFDEDMAKGKTMREFSKSLSPYFTNSNTAAVICHYLTPKKPDFVGDVKFD